MIRVGVFGALGNMGATVCRAVAGDPDLELVGGVDPAGAGRELGPATGTAGNGVSVGRGPDDLIAASPDVVVDFTIASVAIQNLRWAATNDVHAVVGTTGLGPDDIEELSGLFASSKANCLIAPNFAIGAVLMMRFAEQASAHMDSAEIVEMHHDGKADAPSGTSLATARRMGAARESAGTPPFPVDSATKHALQGARGGTADGGVHIHSVRLPGLVAHQEVIFGSAGETLTIRHDSLDRISFMPGVLLAIKRIGELSSMTVGIEKLLGV